MKTYVYIIEQVGGQYCKIGVSNSPVRRMAQLQRKNPDRIAIRYILEPTSESLAYALESQLHRRFHALRLDGEWFRIGAKDALNTIYADSMLWRRWPGLLSIQNGSLNPRRFADGRE